MSNTPGPDARSVAEGFRCAMRRHAASVAILTACHRGRRYGMTVTAMSALSLAPPLVSVGVHRRASMLRPLLASRRFRLILLAPDQERFARACAGGEPQSERVSGVGWSDHDGLPCLERAQASIDCRVGSRIRAGSHDLIVGKVVAAAHSVSAGPLLYFDGAYHACPAPRIAPALTRL